MTRIDEPAEMRDREYDTYYYLSTVTVQRNNTIIIRPVVNSVLVQVYDSGKYSKYNNTVTVVRRIFQYIISTVVVKWRTKCNII